MPNLSQQLVERYRQVTDAFAGGVEDSIGDRCGHADDADLTQTLYTERVDDVVMFRNEDNLYVMHVRVDRDVVVCKVVCHEPPEGLVHHALLFQRRADAHDDRAHDLTVRRLPIQDAAARNSADDPRNANYAEVLIDLHLREHRRMRLVRILHLVRRVFGGGFLFDSAKPAAPHRLDDRNGPRRVVAQADLSVNKRHVVRLGTGER